MNSLSFVLPTYNGVELTRTFLESFCRYNTGGHELIIIDDASNDGTREFLRKLDFSWISVVHNPANIGYASSANLGASMTTGESICFLNNDLVPTKEWLAPMLHG